MSAQPSRTRRRAELSQHFLRKGAVASSLLEATSISRRDLVVEIGAGKGALTRVLVGRCNRPVVVEIDPYLCSRLREELGAEIELVEGDFLTYELPTRRYKIIGSLPYAQTTAIVRRLTSADRPPEDAWLVIQREPARRFAGAPFGAETLWSLRLKPWWQVEIVRSLRRTDFEPPPAVESVLLWLARRSRPLIALEQAQLYRRFSESAFEAGTQLRRAVRRWLTPKQLSRLARELRFDPSRPPSALTFEQWLALFRFVAARIR